MNLEQKALLFAAYAHDGQVRKYTAEPYITHPVAVAEIVRTVPHTSDMIAAAYLHDVVEDCGVDLQTIADIFGQFVYVLVAQLTNASVGMSGNRAERKRTDRFFLAMSSVFTQTIKLADIIHNCQSIAAHDPSFWKVYREEKRALLGVMPGGDETLRARALELIN
ncbi:MAG: HD domain-containing protein [Undibacterium sp.]